MKLMCAITSTSVNVEILGEQDKETTPSHYVQEADPSSRGFLLFPPPHLLST